MSHPGVNMAVTKDGESYNKLRRPDDFAASFASKASPTEASIPAFPSATTSNKRKLDDAEVSESESDDEHDSKRPKAAAALQKPFATEPRRIFRPTRDCGMQSMFPGLDDEDSSDETTKDALAYLRSVRSEASTIPNLLVATPEVDESKPDHSMYNDGQGDFRAVYRDGTWVAVDPDAAGDAEEQWSDYSEDLDPQEQYYTSLLRRYKALRNKFENTDPKELATLVESDPSRLGSTKLPFSRKSWFHVLEYEYPTPARAVQIDEKNLFRVLEYCAEALDRYDTISKQKSCWIWTLLALVGEKGTLDYYKAGRVRDLGHKAGQFSVRLRSGTQRRPLNDDVEDSNIENWDVDGEGTNGEDNVTDPSDADAPEENKPEDATRATTRKTSDEEKAIHEHENIRVTEAVSAKDKPSSASTEINKTDDTTATLLSESKEKKQIATNSTDISPSEDEGELQSEGEAQDNSAPNDDNEAASLEEARARLLAQLGDRLIQPSVPPPNGPKQSAQSHGKPRQGGRHRHNGKVCKDQSCRTNKQRQEAHRKAGFRAAQGVDSYQTKFGTTSAYVYPSREEAEKQRQKMREEQLRQATKDAGLDYDEAPTLLEQKSSDITAVPEALGVGISIPNSSDSKEAIESTHKNPVQPEAVEADVLVEHNNNGAGSETDSEMEDVESVDLNTRVTIDMILTVVAECYGQKDLLRFREVW